MLSDLAGEEFGEVQIYHEGRPPRITQVQETVEVPKVKFIDQEGQVPTSTKVQQSVEVPHIELDVRKSRAGRRAAKKVKQGTVAAGAETAAKDHGSKKGAGGVEQQQQLRAEAAFRAASGDYTAARRKLVESEVAFALLQRQRDEAAAELREAEAERLEAEAELREMEVGEPAGLLIVGAGTLP